MSEIVSFSEFKLKTKKQKDLSPHVYYFDGENYQINAEFIASMGLSCLLLQAAESVGCNEKEKGEEINKILNMDDCDQKAYASKLSGVNVETWLDVINICTVSMHANAMCGIEGKYLFRPNEDLD